MIFFTTFFSAGDAPFYFLEQIKQLSWYPQVWYSWIGFGQSVIFRLWYDYPLQIIIKTLSNFGFSWWFIDKIIWLLVISIGLISSYKLALLFFHQKAPAFFSSLIYTTNTYALMLFGGGQLGVVLGYAFAPFVFRQLIILLNDSMVKNNHKELNNIVSEYINSDNLLHIIGKISITAILISLLVMADLRIAVLTIILAFIYYVYIGINNSINFNVRIYWKTLFNFYFFVFLLVGIIHSYWIIPLVIFRGQSINALELQSSVGLTKFFSFADYSHAISLLHPNWPENLFGKVYFMQTEFLILPIISFICLLLLAQRFKFPSLNQQKKIDAKYIVFFSIISIIGAFLAKGTNPPFGFIYEWFVDKIPGFGMFRDPTKFYLYITLSYSILIPFSLSYIFEEVVKKNNHSPTNKLLIKSIIIVIFISFWIYTIRQLPTGQLVGNFHPQHIDQEYNKLKQLLINDKTFSRTFWIPAIERFGYADNLHPAVDSLNVFSTSSISALIKNIESNEFNSIMTEKGIRYLVVPADFMHRIYLNDYKYDNSLKYKILFSLNLKKLKKISGFNDLTVFDLGYNKPLFYDQNQNIIPSVINNQSEFSLISVNGKKINKIIFLMNYDKYWVLKYNKFEISPDISNDGFMEFNLPNSEINAQLKIIYKPQILVNYLTLFSGLIFFTCMGIMVYILLIFPKDKKDY
jgi:hypothetical protein